MFSWSLGGFLKEGFLLVFLGLRRVFLVLGSFLVALSDSGNLYIFDVTFWIFSHVGLGLLLGFWWDLGFVSMVFPPFAI